MKCFPSFHGIDSLRDHFNPLAGFVSQNFKTLLLGFYGDYAGANLQEGTDTIAHVGTHIKT